MILPISVILLASLLVGAPGPARAEVFLDAYVGKSFTLDSDVRIDQPSRGNDFKIEDLSFDDKSFDDPQYYGVRAGYFFERFPMLGLGVEFFHFKIYGDTEQTKRISGTVNGAPVDANVRVDTVVQRFDSSHGVNYIMFDALFRYPLFTDPERFPRGRVQLYGGAGLGPVVTHAETRIQNEVRSKYELAGLGVQGLVGVRALLFRYVGLFVEYKFTHSDLEFDVANGRAKVDENSHHAVGGLSIHFPSF